MPDPIYKSADGKTYTRQQLISAGYSDERINKGLEAGKLNLVGDTELPEQSFVAKDGKIYTTKQLLDSGYSQDRINKGVYSGILVPEVKKKASGIPSWQEQVSGKTTPSVSAPQLSSKNGNIWDAIKGGYGEPQKMYEFSKEVEIDKEDPISTANRIILSRTKINAIKPNYQSNTYVKKPFSADLNKPIEEIDREDSLTPEEAQIGMSQVRNFYSQNTDESLKHLSALTGLSGEQLYSDDFDKDIQSKIRQWNKTDRIAYERLQEAKKASQIVKSGDSLENMALEYAAMSDPVMKKRLDILRSTGIRKDAPLSDILSGKPGEEIKLPASQAVGEATLGRMMFDLLTNTAFQQEAIKNPELVQEIKQAIPSLLTRYPEFGKAYVGQKVSAKMEKMGISNALLNVVTKDEFDNVITQMENDGELSSAEKYFANKYLRKETGLRNLGKKIIGKESIDTPGLIENILGGGVTGTIDLGKGAAELTGIYEGIMGEKGALKRDLEQVNKRVDVEPKGLLHTITQSGGQFLGQSLSVAGGGGALRMAKLITNPKVALGIAGGVQAVANYAPEARLMFPGESVKQKGYSVLMGSIEALSENIFNDQKVVDGLLSNIKPSVKKVVNDFSAKKISGITAKNLVGEIIREGALPFAKAVGENTIEELTAQVGNQVTKGVFEGKPFKEWIDEEELYNTAKQAFLGSFFIGGLAARGEYIKNKGVAAREIYQMAKDPEYWTEQILELAKTDESISKEAEDKINNLQYASNILKDIEGLDMTEPQRVKYLITELQNKIQRDKVGTITDPTIQKKESEKLAENEKIKEQILSGEDKGQIEGDKSSEAQLHSEERTFGDAMQSAIDNEKIDDVTKNTIRAAMEAEGGEEMLIQEIADQALDRVGNQVVANEVQLERARSKYGDELVDMAIARSLQEGETITTPEGVATPIEKTNVDETQQPSPVSEQGGKDNSVGEISQPISSPINTEQDGERERREKRGKNVLTPPKTESTGGEAIPPAEPPLPPTEETQGVEREEQLPERRFTKQMLRDEELPKQTKPEIAKTLNYVRAKDIDSVKEAREIIDKVGVDEAQSFVINDKDIKPKTRVTLGQVLIRKYGELAQSATDKETQDYYWDKQIQTATFVTEKLATEPGQMVQAFSMWSRLSPEAQLRAANQDMERQGKEKIRRREKDINKISEKFQKANEEAAEEVTQSKKHKEKVEKTESERTKKAKDKIEAAKKKRADIIKKYKGGKGKSLYSSPTGLTPEGIEFVGNVLKTYIDEGIANVEILVDKVLTHLKEVSGKEPTEEVKKNVGDIVAEKVYGIENKKISSGLTNLENKINDIVRKHYTITEEQKKSLVDKFVSDAGLEESEAKELAKEISDEFDKIATRKKRNILYNEKARFDKINNTLASGKKPDKKTLADELIKYTNLGAFNSAEFSELMAKKFGVGELSPEQAAKLMELAKKIEKSPEGTPKRDATEDLLAYRAKLRGSDAMETVQAVWYANILSGYKTHEKNIVSTFFNSWGEMGAEMARDPKSIPYIIGGYIKGVTTRGLLEAYHTLRTGRSPIHIKKIETPNVLERKKFIGGGWNPGNWFKYVMRVMVASDVLSFQGLKEARAYQLARQEAAKNGVNTWSRKGWDKVNEVLLHTKERWEDAKEQASSEGLPEKSIERKRRIYELMEESRPIKMNEESYGFAAHGTFNHESEGTLGAFTNAVSHALDAVNIGGIKPARFVIPFTRIITNVVNNTLDFTPVGLIRAARGKRGFRTFEENQHTKGAFKELSKEERQRLIAKAAIGIAFTAILQALHEAGVIEITGGGPDDDKKKAQLLQSGWHPYSIKIGDKYYSYQYTPMIFMTGFLGNMNDAAKYNPNDPEMIKRMEIALSKMGGQVADMTWINSASTFLGALTERNVAAQERGVSNALAGMGRGFIPFGGTITQFSQLGQEAFSMPQKQVNNSWQALIQDIPLFRNSLNDKINALGDPIVRDPDVILSSETKDPIWKFLLDKGGWVAPVNRGTLIVFDEKIGEDRPFTGDEYFEFSKLRGGKIKSALSQVLEKGLYVNENNEIVHKSADEITSDQLNKFISMISSAATKDTKEEMFGVKKVDEVEKIINELINKINKITIVK